MLLLIGVTLTGATHTHVHTRDYTLTSATTDANTITTKSSSSSSSFDFYVLSMSYQPQFCYQNRFKKYHGCEHPLEFWKGSLTLHGLWPEGNDGSWPSTCTNEKFNHQTVYTIGPTRFNTYWPNVKSSSSSLSTKSSSSSTTSITTTDYSFWEHEWMKHGTCSGLNQIEYFNTTLNHFLDSPSILKDNYGLSVKKTDLMEAYAGITAGNNIRGGNNSGNNIRGGKTTNTNMNNANVVLICAGGGKYLSEVRTCIGKESNNGKATNTIDCIPQVEQEGNCGDVIHISKFYSDDDYDNEFDYEFGHEFGHENMIS
jgi:ribonuclease T2